MSSAIARRAAFVDGISLWTPALPGWDRAAAALRGDPQAPAPSPAQVSAQMPVRPAPAGMAANERRRAPDSVLVALLVAEQALAMSGLSAPSEAPGREARALPSVFTSAHGDLPILDALMRTLADEPALLSPTRFHHSVHNAPSGYWAMASGSHAASTALAAYEHSFGAGLLEALAQLVTEERPVLLAGCDTEAPGPLASVNRSRGLLGAALVLAPQPGPHSICSLHWRLGPTHAPGCTDPTAGRFAGLASNALADALPLFEALALGGAAELSMRCGPAVALQISLQPWPQPRPGAG